VNRYLLVVRTVCGKKRNSYLVASISRSFDARPQFIVRILAQDLQPRQQVAEFLHRFPIFARQIPVHTAQKEQFRLRF
jgi:hypothetical protein